MLKRSLGVTFLGLVALSMAATAQDSFLLRRQLVEGAKDAYTVETVMDSTIQAPTGDMQMKTTTSMLYTINVGKVDKDKGVADVETVVTDIQLKMEGPMADMMQGQGANQIPKEIKANGKLSDRGRMTDMKVQGASAAMMMSMGTASMSGDTFFAYPDGPVKVGDTWDVLTPKMPLLGNKEHKLTAKYVADEAVGDTKAMKVVVAGTIPMDINVSEMMQQMGTQGGVGGLGDMKMLMKGSVEISGTAWLDKASGKILSLENTMDMKTQMELPDMGMTINMPGKAKSTMKLKK